MASVSCPKCTALELEVARLRQLLVSHHIEVDREDAIPRTDQILPLDMADLATPLRRSHSILVRRQSGQIQCLRDVLEDLTPPTNVIEAARRNSRRLSLSIAVPETIDLKAPTKTAEAPKETQRVSSTPPQPENGKAKQSTIAKPKCSQTPNNQEQDAGKTHADILTGIEDKSLGDLFKYAIVLTGPMARPKKNAFSAFFKNNDFRRAKSLQDGGGPSGDGAISRKASIANGSSTSTLPQGKIADCPPPLSINVIVAPAPPPIKILDNVVSPDSSRAKVIEANKVLPPGSPMKRPGWLSNIVPPRFRAGSTDVPASSQLPKPNEAVKIEIAEPPKKQATAQPPTVKVDPTKPRMLAISPPPGKGGVVEFEGLVELCFPYGEKLPPLSDFSVANLRRTLQERHRTYRSPNSTFVLTIASVNHPTEITYAVCVHLPLFPDDESGTGPENLDANGEKLPSHGCISLLSNYPFFSLFFKVVFGIASIWESRRKEYVQDFAIALKEKKAPPTPLTVKDFVDHFESVMNRMKEMRVPAMGGWTRLVLAPQYTPLSFHRPHSESVTAERRMLVLEYAAPVLFAQLSVDQVLFLLGCLCCERKVLVVSDHANIVSSCVLALTTLLQPLQWAGPVITLLPPRLDELLEAPVPLIAGRVSINSAGIPNFSTLTKPMNGVIEMNMDQNNLCMHEEDLMLYHELKLPGCDALVHELQHHSSLLFERHLSPDFPSIEQIQACDAICSRLHRHMESICSLATGEATSLDVASPLYCASPRRQASTSNDEPVWTRRCSEAVQDYMRRFQDTQMFSMFQLQRQEEREEHGLATEDDDDDDDPSDAPTRGEQGATTRRKGEIQFVRLDSSDDGEDAATADTLFADDEAVLYETAA
jgi:hypothetical protein